MRVLEILFELDGGGVDRLLYDYCSRIIPEIEFDFVVTSKSEGILEAPLKQLGCNVFHVAQMRENCKLHIKQMKKILIEGHYDVIHDHSGYRAAINMCLAKKLGVKGRIAHSHIAYIPETAKSKLERYIFTPIVKHYSTELFACGKDAAKWMWGNSKTYIMTNAINPDAFIFNSELRSQLRKKLGIENKFVIGNVARFSYQKNHEFLIEVFNEVSKKREDAVLLLIGRGELFDEIKQKVHSLNLDDKVIFLGVRNDVPDLLNCMDIFALPSRFEGLPVSLVEVQANGLCSLVSDRITKEIHLNDNVFFIPINKGTKVWSELIYSIDNNRTSSKVKNSKYDIEKATLHLKNKYKQICGGKHE